MYRATLTARCDEQNRNQQTLTKLCELAGSLSVAENTRQIEELAEWQELDRLVNCVVVDKGIAAAHTNEAQQRAQANRDKHELARLVKLAQIEKLAQSLLIESGFRADQLHEAQSEREMLKRMSRLLELENLAASHYKIRQSAISEATKKELNELQRMEKLVAIEALSEKHFRESQTAWREILAEQAELERMCQLAALEQNSKSMLNAAQYAQIHRWDCGRDHDRRNTPACVDCKTCSTAHTAKQVRIASVIQSSAQFLKDAHKLADSVHQLHHAHADAVYEAAHAKTPSVAQSDTLRARETTVQAQ